MGGVVDLRPWTGLTPAIYISGERGFTEEKGDKLTMASSDAYVRRSQGQAWARGQLQCWKAHPLAGQVLGGGARWTVAVSKVQRCTCGVLQLP